MADSRIDDLRRRLEREPGSRLFAQLAEELRKSGELVEAIRVARTGLGVHPAYPSARLTLGRALLDSGDPAGARTELETTLREAPDNILASRFLAQAREGLGDFRGAAEQYKKTLQMAPGDRQIQSQLAALELRLAAPAGAAAASAPAPRPLAPAPLGDAPPLAPTVLLPKSEAAAPPPVAAAPPPASPARAVARSGGLEPPPAAQAEFPLAGSARPGTVQHTWFAPADPVAATAALPPTLVESAQSASHAPEVASPVPPAAPPPAPPAAPPPVIAAAAVVPAAAPAAPAAPPHAPPTEGTSPFSSSTLAELYYQQGLVERAVDVYRQLVTQDPANEKARLRLVELESAEGVPDERATRRRALERTIAGLESLLAAVQRR